MQKFLYVTAMSSMGFCSMLYELSLAQMLTITMGNTVLRYSLTIGLYLFSLGVGALYLYVRPCQSQAKRLLQIEWCLTILGLCLPFLIFGGASLSHKSQSLSWIYAFFSHGMVLIIGILTGMELPLLVGMAEAENAQDQELERWILGSDYVASFVATLVFPLVFLPMLGLIQGVFLVALLNVCVTGLLFYVQPQSFRIARHGLMSMILALFCVIGVVNHREIQEFFTRLLF